MYHDGARAKRRWPTKDYTIFMYVRTEAYYFTRQAVREPQTGPGLVTADSVAHVSPPTW